MKEKRIQSRKKAHLRICLEDDVQSSVTTGLENYRLPSTAIPELNLNDIDLNSSFFEKSLKIPFLFSAMTGGIQSGGELNRRLAEVAQEKGMALCVGSQRAAVEDETLAASFEVRSYAPDILLFANMGAVQLNHGIGVDGFQRAVEMIEADALVLHFNALQEAIQPEGEVDFSDLLSKIETLCKASAVPVIAKEVGWGFSKSDIRHLLDAGVSGFDVAGAGGTSWSQVEKFRAEGTKFYEVADAFRDWGIPTADAICNVNAVDETTRLIASGGLQNGVDAAKCFALGADIAGFARLILAPAMDSVESLANKIDVLTYQLRVAMFCSGVGTLQALKSIKLDKVN